MNVNLDISILLGLLGGLALFLYGMQMMSAGLEAAAGNRMKGILERLTSNRFLGILVGAGITAVIQSSSATTVMVVGFVNSGMMTLKQAVWIIMGANIGTTITGQLIALDVGAVAPLFAFVGVAMVVFLKKPQIHHYGNILAGLGVLFIGMEMMGSAMEPLREWPAFVNLVSTFSNPVVGILAGAAFTALIQSSSASVGILQALALSGVIGLDSAVYVLFGQNIGTCITAVLASIGTSRNAKRTTIIHLMFNVFGTVLFTVICMATPLTGFMQSMTPDNPAAQIANMHTLFNIVTTLLLLPFGGYLVKIAMRILPDRKEDKEEGMHLAFLVPMPASKQEHPIGFSAMYVTQIRQELNRMMGMAKENIATSFQAVLERDVKRVESAEATEEYIDYLNKEISQYISNIIVHETNEKDSTAISAYFKITGNIERIGDHAMNICEYTQMLDKKKIQFSEEAQEELRTMEAVCLEVLDLLEQESIEPTDWLTKVSALEQRMDDMTEEYRRNQMKRMKQGSCSDEACIIFSELLTDFERIGDHALNIAQERAGIATEATDACQKDRIPAGGHGLFLWISEGGALGFDVRLAGLHGLEGALQQVVELPTQELGSLGDGLPGAAGGKLFVLEFLAQTGQLHVLHALGGAHEGGCADQSGEFVHGEEHPLHFVLRLGVALRHAPAVADYRVDEGRVQPAGLHDLTHLDAVLLRVALEVQVVQQPRLGQERGFLPVTQLPGEPAHHVLHCNGVAQVELLLVILGQQVPGLLSCHGHL